MARKLTENISSAYIEAANRLKPKRKGKRVAVYVESYDDVLFWRSVLEEFESPDIHFDVMLPSRNTLAKGKNLALSHELGDGLIACVDADYDYLIQGRTEHSQKMLQNPYVFHTYVYAIESYQCYAPGLHTACVMATLNDREVIDLEEFMLQYSLILWPLLVWSIWLYRHDHYKQFSIQDMAGEVSFRDINVYHPEETLDYVRRHVNKAVNWMQRTFPEAKKAYEPLKQELVKLGVTPETTYLYMQGHTLFDGVVLPLLNPICTLLRRERENEIKRLACHEKQRQNELSCYQHSVGSIDVMLKKGLKFRESEPYQRLRRDLSAFVERICAAPQDANSVEGK
ncbi:MAG: DUF4435 domain-containing protein [Bacteroidaceae bacterium]|nr:DUF4435 domain-containing protein [Bacteroidaceae bacterium]